jgi:hypothetical protein
MRKSRYFTFSVVSVSVTSPAGQTPQMSTDTFIFGEFSLSSQDKLRL